METKSFYRIANHTTYQGLWYDFNGNFTGLIHNELNFCKNSELQMPFDEELVGWLSATETLEELYNWFSIEDIKELQNKGWKIYKYEASNYKFYDTFQHYVISQETSKLLEQITI